MNIRTKLAAIALATGTIVGGGAALTLTSAEAAPPVKGPFDPRVTITLPPHPTFTLPPKPPVTLPPVTVTPPPTKPTPTTKPTDTTKPADPAKPRDTTKPYDEPYYPEHNDAPVHVRPSFTG